MRLLPWILRYFLSDPPPPLYATSIYPLLAFRPLSEELTASTAPGPVRDDLFSAAYPKLTSVGFHSLQHFRSGKSTCSGGCHPPCVPFSGFGYPLNGLLLPEPLNHFSGSSVHGISPSESCSLRKAVSPLGALCSLALRRARFGRSPSQLARLQSFEPSAEPHPQCQRLGRHRGRYSLGVTHLWGFRPRPRSTLSGKHLFCTSLTPLLLKAFAVL